MIFTILILIQLIIAVLILKQAKNTKILWIMFFHNRNYKYNTFNNILNDWLF